MTCKCARYDASGNRILPRKELLVYYKNDPESLYIVQRNMPHRYVVIPDIEIRINTKNPVVATVYTIYPGETRENEVFLSPRSLANLRRLYCRKTHWRVDKSKPDRVIYHRKGSVILDPFRRYGVWRNLSA